MRVVLDVNVWISALLWKGVPGQILLLAKAQQIAIFASEALLTELETPLCRAKFQRQIQSLGLSVEDLIASTSILQFCTPTFVDVPQLRDPKDIIILAAAVAANAEAIVTGDLDLLVLTEFNGIPILTPQAFLSRYFPN